ncbi:MAG: tRNA (guanosine(37)-N1)-methyltransferase TrmD [Candidatus Liptonbacteria bacterium]|nr:tRNA (guanosine(37)-N1)-methyltransferase TrmD [Candidatus Liptonbacteria bacterium]
MTLEKRRRFDIITIFPKIFDSYIGESFFKRAIKAGLIEIRTHNLRDFTNDKHARVDDRPFGGGPGMVLKIEPIFRAVQNVRVDRNVRNDDQAKRSIKRSDRAVRTRVILFSTRGKKLDAKMAQRLAKYDQLILICGRYEGVDERVAKYVADEEISIGDYVLSGGELPAAVLIETISRFLPGFLGKRESLEEVKGTYPVYTQPADFRPIKSRSVWKAPKVLLSGDHKKIQAWRSDKKSSSGV